MFLVNTILDTFEHRLSFTSVLADDSVVLYVGLRSSNIIEQITGNRDLSSVSWTSNIVELTPPQMDLFMNRPTNDIILSVHQVIKRKVTASFMRSWRCNSVTQVKFDFSCYVDC